MEAARLLPFFVQGFASTTFFTTRPFLTVLGFALFARYGLEVLGGDVVASMAPAGIELLSYGNLASTPWILGDTALIIFGLLALLEFGATTSDDLRFWYNQTLWLVQPGSAFVVTFSFGNSEVTFFLEWIASLLPTMPVAVAGLGDSFGGGAASAATQWGEALTWLGHALALVWSALIAIITWFLGRLRAVVVDIIEDLDEDNSLGLQTMMHWAEMAWTAIGTYILFILPSLALIMAGLTVATMFLIRKYFEHRERRSYVPCGQCATPTHPSAPFCPSCKVAREQVRQIGLFGQARDTLAAEPTAHRLQLMARKRCPFCAGRLHEKALRQTCQSCGTTTFANISEANSYIRVLDGRLTQTTLIVSILGLIPLVGLVPAMIYYRLSLISSIRSYLPRSTGCFTRWGVRMLNIFLVMLQAFPGVGAIAMPMMCLTNYWVYKQVFTGAAHSALQPAAPTQTMACPGCGAPGQRAQRFCTQCGQQLQPT